MSASDIMISAAVRRRVRVCQRVTSCEYFCKSLNTDGVKGTNLLKASIQPHWHTIHPFSLSEQPYKNVHDGSYGFCVPRWSRWSILILCVDNSQVKIYLKKQEDLRWGKKLITSDLLQIIKGQKRLVKYKQGLQENAINEDLKIFAKEQHQGFQRGPPP